METRTSCCPDTLPHSRRAKRQTADSLPRLQRAVDTLQWNLWLCAHERWKCGRYSDCHCQGHACVLHSLFSATSFGKTVAERGRLRQTVVCSSENITHILTTDSHPAELLASNIMKGNRQSADDAHNRTPFLPNVVLVGRDAAHASTRLVKRPWACIPAIQDIGDRSANT